MESSVDTLVTVVPSREVGPCLSLSPFSGVAITYCALPSPGLRQTTPYRQNFEAERNEPLATPTLCPWKGVGNFVGNPPPRIYT